MPTDDDDDDQVGVIRRRRERENRRLERLESIASKVIQSRRSEADVLLACCLA